MKIKTEKLVGAALDWAVATCEGWGRLRPNPLSFNADLIMSDDRGDAQYLKHLDYSTDWAQSGPIIEREKIDLFSIANGNGWCAQSDVRVFNGYGPTPLIAAMRCYVASKLGEEVEIPEELI